MTLGVLDSVCVGISTALACVKKNMANFKVHYVELTFENGLVAGECLRNLNLHLINMGY